MLSPNDEACIAWATSERSQRPTLNVEALKVASANPLIIIQTRPKSRCFMSKEQAGGSRPISRRMGSNFGAREYTNSRAVAAAHS